MNQTCAAILLGILVLLHIPPSQAAEVCRAAGIVGMEKSKARGTSFMPKNTSDATKAVVYVEFVDDVLYYHSNFITPGHEYPTKVVGNPLKNDSFRYPEQVFVSVVHDKKPSDAEWAQTEATARTKIELLVDQSVFDDDGIPRIDLSNIQRFKLVDANKGMSLAGTSELLVTTRPPPSLISRIRGCCLFARPPHLASFFGDQLAKRAIDTKKFKVASMFVDSATDNAMANSQLVKGARLSGDGRSLKDEAAIATLMHKASGQTLILIGHVEDSNYVIRNANNTELLNVPIATVRTLARKNKVLLIDIGCETTRSIRGSALGFGVASKYNSVEAVNSVERALKSTTDLSSFLEKLSSDDLRIVIDRHFVDGIEASVHSTIYARLKNQGKTA